jgi:hypothetical protein
MFIKPDVAKTRLDDDENLVSLVIKQSGLDKSSEFPITPEVVDEDDEVSEQAREAIVGTVKPHHPGRTNGSKGVPDEFKVAAGLMAHFDSVRNVASALGLDKMTVNAARNGESSTGKRDENLRSKIEEDLTTVRDKALDRLLSSLNLLDDRKIEKASARDISGISANMAKVMAMTLPKEQEVVSRAQLIVYAPTQINESKFEVVEI